MSTPRLHTDAALEPGAEIAATPAQAHHLGTVLRRGPGDAVALFNARDGEFAATVTALRKDREPPLVLDGPFAETKEQLLGFYIVNCASLDEALDIARDLGRANPGGSYEIRPVAAFFPGGGTP